MDDLKKLFEPYEGENVRPHPDGKQYVVWVPYAHDIPIVVPDKDLAEQIERAISSAHSSGVSDGQVEY